MNNQLKQILLNVARLPRADQRWLLRQLSSTQQQIFDRFHGKQELARTQRFRKLKINPHSIVSEASTFLPGFTKNLACNAPLFVAIILAQGQFSWQHEFLKIFDKEGLIQDALDHQLKLLKITAKQLVFTQWENSLSFDAYMEPEHG